MTVPYSNLEVAVPYDVPDHFYASSTEPPKVQTPQRSNTRKTWLIIVAVVVLVGALAGGLAGGLLSRNRSGASNTDDATASTPTNATTSSSTGPLALSQLASLNWTDSSQILRRAVFYQHDNALFLSQYHQSNDSWTAFNISDVFERESISINAKQGTPLATAATSIDDINAGLTDFTATLFYLDTDNYIQELVCTDEDLISSWSLGDLQNHKIIAAENSNLAALAYFCPNDGQDYLCNNQFTILYQAVDQSIMFVGATGWEPSKMASGWPGGGVAMYPFASDDGTNLTDVSEIRFYYQTNTIIELSIQNYLGRYTAPGESNPILSNQEVRNDLVPKIVASPRNYHSEAIIMSMDGAGNITGTYYSPNTWNHDNKIRFQNQDGATTVGYLSVDLTSIAMDHNGTFYGISANGSAIMAYSWSAESIFGFVWKESITVS
ncbi:hypothetical protein PFICI_12418 [Pestalotiopsis fici W106-1]|uniref:Uncharacterized protein n=1 Tax=Pestalotiopsis fici (strain W106-1 / CGMCC3.15140) TaxID=1229662 RepID=W3WNV4_PESFW|nr:uncharacterized protein PFICI_12418 [Pestalotiopsis fici W106-1]ETS75474.1 hypothetical protein PFICI_12418 [Pestalotiopsis fici W106-1]